jgi:hypothetical protein
MGSLTLASRDERSNVFAHVWLTRMSSFQLDMAGELPACLKNDRELKLHPAASRRI